MPSDGNLLAWWHEQAEWSEPHAYVDAAVSTPSLQAFYRDLIKIFPPMNGPDAPTDDDEADTDYAIGNTIIYVSFRWSKADHARRAFIEVARAHGIGVCEISESLAASTISDESQPMTAPVAGEQDTTAVPAAAESEEKSQGESGEKSEGQIYL